MKKQIPIQNSSKIGLRQFLTDWKTGFAGVAKQSPDRDRFVACAPGNDHSICVDLLPLPRTAFKVFGLMLFFLLLFDVSSLEAVYFANDTFILYEDGQRVLDSGVICTNEKDGGNWVCHCGVLVVSQHDLKKTFYRTKEKVVKSWHAWVRSFEDQEYAYQNVDEFRKYMQSLKEQSEYRVTLSFLAASGGIAAPPGFCGGRIGDPRTFQVDLKKKTVIEIKDESLPQDIRQLVKEVREMDRNGEL